MHLRPPGRCAHMAGNAEIRTKRGKGLFFDTYTKHKCGGAPKKICMLAEHLSRKLGTREKLDFNYCTASRELYDVPFFTKRLLEIYKERNIPVSTRTKLKGIDTSTKTAYFQTEVPSKTDPSKTEILEKKEGYDFIHFLPPMTAPDFVKKSGLSIETGKKGRGGLGGPWDQAYPRAPEILQHNSARRRLRAADEQDLRGGA